MILRRLYIYLVSAAALAVFAFGLAQLGDTILEFVLRGSDTTSSRTTLAGYTAAVVVALPVWAIHLWFGGRLARREPAERASAIRRRYLYLACTVFSIAAAYSLSSMVTAATQQQLDGAVFDQVPIAQLAWFTIVMAATWAFHYRIAARDRAAVGEVGASATLRRWYMYIALFVGLFTMLGGARGLLALAWLRLLHSSAANFVPLSAPAGELAGGFLLWAFHARVLVTRFANDDRRSELRAVEGFIAVAACIAAALISASQILYYSAAHILGVANPGGAGSDLLVAFAQPASTMVVYGAAWLLIRRRLARDAGTGEGTRLAAMRRFYTNLAALVSMAALAVGAVGVLATLLIQAEAQLIGVTAPDWKDPLSLWITLLVVGGAVWLAHWRPVPWLEERQAISRRIYLWAALLGSVLGLLGGGIGLLYVILQQAFSVRPRLDDPTNLGFAQSLAVVLVALAVGLYHWRILRSDSTSRRAVPLPPQAAPAVTVPAQADEPVHATEAVPGLHYSLSVVGATEDDVHQALANLPPQASYHLKASDQPT